MIICVARLGAGGRKQECWWCCLLQHCWFLDLMLLSWTALESLSSSLHIAFKHVTNSSPWPALAALIERVRPGLSVFDVRLTTSANADSDEKWFKQTGYDWNSRLVDVLHQKNVVINVLLEHCVSLELWFLPLDQHILLFMDWFVNNLWHQLSAALPHQYGQATIVHIGHGPLHTISHWSVDIN